VRAVLWLLCPQWVLSCLIFWGYTRCTWYTWCRVLGVHGVCMPRLRVQVGRGPYRLRRCHDVTHCDTVGSPAWLVGCGGVVCRCAMNNFEFSRPHCGSLRQAPCPRCASPSPGCWRWRGPPSGSTASARHCWARAGCRSAIILPAEVYRGALSSSYTPRIPHGVSGLGVQSSGCWEPIRGLFYVRLCGASLCRGGGGEP